MPEPTHFLKIGSGEKEVQEPKPSELRSDIEPWLSAVVQSEHLVLLVGNGLLTAVAACAGCAPVEMAIRDLSDPDASKITDAAEGSARAAGRRAPNLEDQIQAALSVIAGRHVLADPKADDLRRELDDLLKSLAADVLACERSIAEAMRGDDDAGVKARRLLISFLMSFASRSASRERLHLATTNYDRLLEYGCDLAGLRTIDRFVGALEPVFRASRLDVDMHYNPPGIRGEPRYLEGVVRLGKVHGSLDWSWRDGELARVGLPFGALEDHPALPERLADALMVFPNPAKDAETLDFPYSELFRDLSAALCRPNTALVTYGYGFGDDHVNRVIADMLSVPSTHLVAVSYDWCDGRLRQFLDRTAREAQVSLLIGPHFGDLETLVMHYLPKPAIDTISLRQAELLERRRPLSGVRADDSR